MTSVEAALGRVEMLMNNLSRFMSTIIHITSIH